MIVIVLIALLTLVSGLAFLGGVLAESDAVAHVLLAVFYGSAMILAAGLLIRSMGAS